MIPQLKRKAFEKHLNQQSIEYHQIGKSNVHCSQMTISYFILSLILEFKLLISDIYKLFDES